jgi:four helix bundle protein
MQNYKDLKIWSKLHQLTWGLYKAKKSFLKEEMFGLRSQLRRAASLIAAMNAEGCGRGTQGDMGKFLKIFLGSANHSGCVLNLVRDLR